MINIKITAFWDVMLCSLVDIYLHFGGMCYAHFQGRRVSYPEDGDNMLLCSGSKYLLKYMVLHPKW
jgi:hypothetical protein